VFPGGSMERLGEMLKKYKKANRYTLNDLAKKLKVTPKYVSDIIHEERIPRRGIVLEELAELFDLTKEKMYLIAKQSFENKRIEKGDNAEKVIAQLKRDFLGDKGMTEKQYDEIMEILYSKK
jgi:transcriptional regulator with XRE-family HTH domain